ncbi:MAG: histidine--tRNA ligase [Eubacteriales bacterium]|nr:histidine--tRNA ligase [Eubacteriales bacterium]
MEKVTPRTLSGFMELSPMRQAQFDRMLNSLRESYALYGFTALDTTVIESAEVHLAKGGGETEKQIYRFQKGDNDLALRFDLTVPLAKYVAARAGELSFPFRRFQIGKVYRGERAQRGRFREFYQADIDVIGDGTLDIMNEAEIPAVIYRSFTALGLRNFRIRINNRKVLNGFFSILGVRERAAEVLRAVDKLEKIGADKLRVLLINELGMDGETADRLLAFISCSGSSADKLAFLEGWRGQEPLFDTGLDELRAVTEHMTGFGVPEENFELDLTIARGLDYYTGTVYETMLTEHPEIGSICSGGRYDNLAEFYTNRKLPGVGISIGLTRLFYVLEEQGMLSDECVTAPADALVIPLGDTLPAAIRTATVLRAAGVRTQLYFEPKKFKARLTYASRLGIPYAVIVGEDEAANGTAAVKDLTTGVQEVLTPEEAAKRMLEGLAVRAAVPPIRDEA